MFSLIAWAIAEYINPTYCGQAEYCPFSKVRLRGKIGRIVLIVPLVLLAPLVLAELSLFTIFACIVWIKDKLWIIPLVLVCSLVFVGEAHSESIDLWIIAKIESNFNPNAYNKTSKALGMFQIVNVCLKDYNALNNPKIAKKALKNPLVAKRVANWYINKRIPQLIKKKGAKDTIKNRLIAYNAGHCYVNKKHIPKETRQYIIKYYNYLNERGQNVSARSKDNKVAG